MGCLLPRRAGHGVCPPRQTGTLFYELTPRGVANESYLLSCLGRSRVHHRMLDQTLSSEHYVVDGQPVVLGRTIDAVVPAVVGGICAEVGCDQGTAVFIPALAATTGTLPIAGGPGAQIDAEWAMVAAKRIKELRREVASVQRKADRLHAHRQWLRHRRKHFGGENPFYDTVKQTGKPCRTDKRGVPQLERSTAGVPLYDRFWRFMAPCDPAAAATAVPTDQPSVTNRPFSLELKDLLNKMLDVDARQRITIEEVCDHPWLRTHQAPDPSTNEGCHETDEQRAQFIADMQKRTVLFVNRNEGTFTVTCDLSFEESVLKVLPCLGVNGTRYSMAVIDESHAATTKDGKVGIINVNDAGPLAGAAHHTDDPVDGLGGGGSVHGVHTIFVIEVYAGRWELTWQSSTQGAASLAEWHTFKAALAASVGGQCDKIEEHSRHRASMESWRRVGSWKKTPAAAREARLKRLFQAIDDDSSGFIEAPELRKALKAEGIDLSMDRINELIDGADDNSDGKLSYDEFKSVLAKLE